jgi:hypothetical protein
MNFNSDKASASFINGEKDFDALFIGFGDNIFGFI